MRELCFRFGLIFTTLAESWESFQGSNIIGLCQLISHCRARNCDQYSRIYDLIFAFATKISGGVANLRVVFA